MKMILIGVVMKKPTKQQFKELRLQRKETQAEYGKHFGFAHPAQRISSIERGDRGMSNQVATIYYMIKKGYTNLKNSL